MSGVVTDRVSVRSEPLTPEELERGTALAKRYTQQMMKRHKIQEKDLQQKIRHKWRAIHALPTIELRKEVRAVASVALRRRGGMAVAAVLDPLLCTGASAVRPRRGRRMSEQ